MAPGTYTLSMHHLETGEMTEAAPAVTFEVEALGNTVMPAKDRDAKAEFQRMVAELSADIEVAQRTLSEVENKMKHIKKAVQVSEISSPEIMKSVVEINAAIRSIKRKLNGDRAKARLDIESPPTPPSRIGILSYEQKYSTSSPTKTHRDSYAIAKEEFAPIQKMINDLVKNEVIPLEQTLDEMKVPFTLGSGMN